MAELIVDFITSLDGYASGEGWPGWWGLQGPEYLKWEKERPDRDYTLVMGVTILYGALIVLANLVVDLLQAMLDPRVRLQ